MEPSIELDIYADKPSALSPALASMNYITMTRDPPTFRPPTIDEDSLALLKELHAGGVLEFDLPSFEGGSC